uniref:Trichome birefringence-like C-terminal domain-containing protein n=1 Tax=Oryza brachyantha TaxID=4533 RepID=J3MCR5_ORYBR
MSHYQRLLKQHQEAKPSLLPSSIEMGAYQPLQQQQHHGQKHSSSTAAGGGCGYFLPRTVVTWLAAACLSLALLHLLCCSPPGGHEAVFAPLLQYFNGTYSYISSGVGGGGGGGGGGVESSSCDYSEGRWVVGVHAHPELNHTEIGFTSPYREAFRMALERLASDGRRRTVVLGTFAPPHFEGKPIFDPTACTKTEPYKEGEKELGSIETEMRTIVFEEAAAAAERDAGGGTTTMRIAVQDVTRLASMRPDGHPGPYMHRDPFARGVPERMQTDCLHSCLPGPVDTFNEILLQILERMR